MNTVNASTGFSGFQLRLGQSPHVIPPLHETLTLAEERSATDVIEQLRLDTMQAQDALIRAKVSQAHQINKTRAKEFELSPGDKVWLTTKNRRREYLQRNKGHVAK
ncbi:hypothetical protein L218DRAFT_838543, partial [Marasmius fiardii PR-910]